LNPDSLTAQAEKSMTAYYAAISAILLDHHWSVQEYISIAYKSATLALLHLDGVAHPAGQRTAREREEWRRNPQNPINSPMNAAIGTQGFSDALDFVLDITSPLAAPLYEVRDRLVVARHGNVIGKYQRSMSALAKYVSELPKY
jgi:hypothetical protein